ncbi:MAG: tetratricopeptide repeat protein [Syntrophales bacterium]
METPNRENGLKVLFISTLLLVYAAGCANEKAANIHLNMGLAYLESRQYSSALKELMDAEKENPQDPRIHYYLGITYHAKNLPDEAIRELKKAVEIKTDYSEAYNYMGMVYDGMGRYDLAIQSFKNALSNILYETPSYAMNNMAWSYFKKGDYDSALLQFSEALKHEPNMMNHAALEKNIGVVLYRKSNPNSAVMHLKRSLEIAPDFVEARYWLGKCYLLNKDRKSAISEFNAVIKAAPDSEFALRARSELDSMSAAAEPEKKTRKRRR